MQAQQPNLLSNTAVLTAVLAAIASILIAIWNFFAARMNNDRMAENQKKLEETKNELAEKIEKLKRGFSIEKSDLDAKRDYEYEARKKLYQEYEPIKFNLVESCESAKYSIDEICSRCITRENYQIGLLPIGNYCDLATMYHLMLPVVNYCLSKKKLTNVDLELNPKIHLIYLLSKQIYISFYSDAVVATLSKLDYTPYVENWRELRKDNPFRYRRQGFPSGRLDNAIHEFISDSQVISFGEFENKIQRTKSDDFSGPLGTLKDLFADFDPHRRPVLWRIISIQYLLYDLIIYSNYNSNASLNDLTDKVSRLLETLPKRFEVTYDNLTINSWESAMKEYFEKKVFPSLEIHLKP